MQVVLKMPEASPQGVSNSLWAFAKLTGASPLQGDLFRAGYSRALEVGSAIQNSFCQLLQVLPVDIIQVSQHTQSYDKHWIWTWTLDACMLSLVLNHKKV